ncbi:MAG: DUF928 domain-containing protein [Cyanobacteriota bacterium]
MHQIKCLKGLATLSLTLLLTVASGSFSPSVRAEKPRSDTGRQGLPGRRVGGGTRGDCYLGEKTLTALIPQNNIGLTVSAHPTFFFYVPQSSNAQLVEFVLRDENDQLVYEKQLRTNGPSGIVSFSLPEAIASEPLKVNQKYHWYFSMICNPQNRAHDVSVDGWVQRVEPTPTLTRELEAVTLPERAALYAEAGFWHDALTTLAQLRYSRPYDWALAAQWAQLLQSVGLDELAQEPLVNSLVSAQQQVEIPQSKR